MPRWILSFPCAPAGSTANKEGMGPHAALHLSTSAISKTQDSNKAVASRPSIIPIFIQCRSFGNCVPSIGNFCGLLLLSSYYWGVC